MGIVFVMLTCFDEGMVSMRTWTEDKLLKKLVRSLEAVALTRDRQVGHCEETALDSSPAGSSVLVTR